MSYTRVNWQDAPSVSTPLSASNLNKMDAGIKQNADDIEQLQQHTYDSALNDTSTNAPQTKVVKKAIEDAVESVTIITDPTLSNEGQAADAKATGEAVAQVKSAFSVNGLLYEISYEDLNGYISNIGVITTSGSWKHTEPIELKKLETISFTGTSVNSGIAMIALVTSNGSVLNPVAFGIDNTSRTYEYTAVEDCFVSVSHYADETAIKKGITQETLQSVYSNIEEYTGKNIVDVSDTIDGFYVSAKGYINNLESFCYVRHLIHCKPNTAYATIHNGTVFLAYYDASKTFISGTTANATTFITPDNCYYMRVSFAISHKQNCMICLASEKDRTYQPYIHGYSIDNIPNANKVNHIYVGTNSQYQTIISALNAITDATESNRYVIHVSKGTYEETFYTKNYVDIVGDDKYKTVINYTSDDETDYVNRSTIFATSFTTLENLTITTTGAKYPLHCDGAYNIPYKVIVKNCIVKHNGFTTLPTQAGTAVGIGLYHDQHVEIIDSECIASGVFGCASVYCHNFNDPENKSGYRSIKIKHSTLSNSTYGFRLEAIENNEYQDNDAWLIGIINNGETQIRNTHVTKDSWHLHQYS